MLGTAALIGAGLGAALGAGKYAAQKGQEASDKKVAAATDRYSPWTGMKAGPITRPDAFGDLTGGAISGAAFGQGLGSASAPSAGAVGAVQSGMNNMPASGVGMGTGMGMNYGYNSMSPWLMQGAGGNGMLASNQ